MFQILLSLELTMLIICVDCLGFIVITHWCHLVCHVIKVDVLSFGYLF